MSGTEQADDYAIVGDCAGCGGQMIEVTAVETDDERRATLECQDCDAEAEIRHDFEDGLDGGSWSGVGDPEIKPVSWIYCQRCDGHGYIKDPICDLRRAMNGREYPCPNCHTSGKVPRVVETDGGTDTSGTDREGIGILYAGGTGIMIGSSVAYGSEPTLGWVTGSVVMALGLAYEVHQRYVHTGSDRTGSSTKEDESA